MLIEILNKAAEGFFRFAWPMVWQSSLLIAALFALDFALRRKVRAAVRYALWLVVLVKLVVPPSLALPTGLAWWLRPSSAPAPRAETGQFVVSYSDGPLPVDSYVPVVAALAPPKGPRLSLSAIGLSASGGVSLVLFGFLVWRWCQVARQIRKSEEPSDELREFFMATVRETGVRGRVRLRVTSDLMSPAVCGLIRPCVVLPRALVEKFEARAHDLFERGSRGRQSARNSSSEKLARTDVRGYDPAQLRAVLLHELMHVRRADVWLNCAQTLLQIVYWWHPLLWFANARIRRLREEAVDDAVMMALREDSEVYAPTLLEVAKLAFHRPLASLGLVGILESKRALSRRIERLLDFQPPKRAGLSFVSVLGVAAFTCMAVPQGEAPPKPDRLSAAIPSPAPLESATAAQSSVSPTNFPSAPDSRQKIANRLSRIHLDAVRFDYMSLTNVVRVLTDKARVNEAEKDGVNFSVATDVLEAGDVTINVTPVLYDVALLDVLDIIVAAADKKIKYTISDSGVVLSRKTPVRGDLVTRMFYVEPESFLGNLERLVEAKPGTFPRGQKLTGTTPRVVVRDQTPSRVQEALRSVFLARGVDLKPPMTIFWNDRQSSVLARVAKDDIDATESLVATLNTPLPTSADSPVQPRIVAEAQAEKPQGRLIAEPGTLVTQEAKDESDRLTREAAVLFELRKLDEAVAKIKEAIKLNPNNQQAYHYFDLIQEALLVEVQKKRDENSRRILAEVDSGSAWPAPGTLRKTNASAELFTRIFRVDPNTFVEGLWRSASPAQGNARTNNAEAEARAFRTLLKSKGVNLDAPKSVFWNERQGTLLVSATRHELDVIEAEVAALNTAPPQIHIQAKFVEIPQKASAAFWESLDATNHASGPEGIILSSTQAVAVMKALESQKGVAVLASPRVTTLAGQRAQLQIGQSLPVVTGVTNGEKEPKFLFTNIFCGPVVDLIPRADADNQTIRLTTTASVKEFLGYDDPGKEWMVEVLVGGKPTRVKLPLPRFRTSNWTTNVALLDGQTLVLGKPQVTETVNKKGVKPAPKTEAARKDLVVFITPTLIDEAGNPLRK